VLVPIVVMTVLMGVLPNLFLRPIEPSVERMLNQVRRGAPTQIQAIDNSQFTIHKARQE
jgi:NADH:ubiquinone oxidoreductase subunit 4 (subunit M)